jgi:hypothetical protein
MLRIMFLPDQREFRAEISDKSHYKTMGTEQYGRVYLKYERNMDTINNRAPTSQGPSARTISSWLRLLLIASAGALIVIVMQLIPSVFPVLNRPSILQPASDTGGSFATYISRVQHFLYGPYLVPIWFLWLIYLAISRRDQPKYWVYALLAGGSLPGIIFHFILHWI